MLIGRLRLPGISDHFDSQSLLFTLLCGDNQLPERFRQADLLPLGSHIGPRLLLTPQSPEMLHTYLNFALEQAGCPHLMTDTDRPCRQQPARA